MIKYRYIPFTHGKPRYRRLDTQQQQQVQQQWQLKAQSLPAVVPSSSQANINENVAAAAAAATPIPQLVKTYSSGTIVPELSSGSGGGGVGVQILWDVPKGPPKEHFRGGGAAVGHGCGGLRGHWQRKRERVVLLSCESSDYFVSIIFILLCWRGVELSTLHRIQSSYIDIEETGLGQAIRGRSPLRNAWPGPGNVCAYQSSFCWLYTDYHRICLVDTPTMVYSLKSAMYTQQLSSSWSFLNLNYFLLRGQK